ncbi:patatin-like phospholipase domain-containing protein 4 [Lytechinus variegatus]|uniref:patatin-like phospholipase domain-containing protein 4 n=1 Tax=Lytechinus variegatus TaxID=7654 RepID=UPI001BB174D7|nr:patatin-like phospholipase domain-containing protein 4 [Lytechinus variegatus]XP_041472021.1 patatin-like phospholipase domain-containing protein 4 [Lytechinus variegatus]
MEGCGPYRISFSGNSFLGVYDLGCAMCLLDHGKRLLQNVESYWGISSGGLTAALMMSAPECLRDYLDAILALSTKIHSLPQGALTPGFDFTQEVRHILEALLKNNCHITCSNQLHVQLQELVTTEDIPAHMRRRPQTLEEELQPLKPPTKTDIVMVDGKAYLFGEKQVVSAYSSKHALTEVLVAAIYYPSTNTASAPKVMEKHYIDVSALPDDTPKDAADSRFPSTGHVIAIAPNKNAGLSRPKDNLTLGLRDVSRDNYVFKPWHMFRLGEGLYPPRREDLEKTFWDGVSDATEFLKKFEMYESGSNSYPQRSTMY